MNKILCLSDFMYVEDLYSKTSEGSFRAFSSWQGSYIRKFLTKAGILNPQLDYLFDDVIAKEKRYGYVLKDIVLAENPQVRFYLNSLERKIIRTNPNIIICFSRSVFHYLTGLNPDIHRGTTTLTTQAYNNRFIKTILTLDMETVVQDYIQHYTVLRDLKKAYTESLTPEISPDTREPMEGLGYAQTISVLDSILESADMVAYDVETLNTHVTHVGFAWTEDKGISIQLVNGCNPRFESWQEMELWVRIARILSTKKIIAHNMSYDNSILLKHLGIFVPNCYMDTMIAAHCILPEAAGTVAGEDKKKKQGLGLNLGYLCSIYLNVPAWKHTSQDNKSLYNALDAIHTYRLAMFFKKEITQHNLFPILDLKMKELQIAMLMQHRGILIDMPLMEKLKTKVSRRVSRYQKILDRLTGSPINYNSPKQVTQFLYVTLGLPIQTNKEKKPTADAEALRKLLKLTKDKKKTTILSLMSRRTEFHTLQKSFLNLNPSSENRVHTSYNVVGTSFSRWSSSGSIIYPYGNGAGGKINLQNIPKTYGIRNMFVTTPDMYIGSLDFVQAEAVIIAYLIQDSRNIDIFRRNFGKPKSERIDFHIENAKRFFPNQPITEKLRAKGKTCSHAANYAVGAFQLARALGVTQMEARKNLEAIHQAKPEIRRWHRKIQSEINQNGYLVNPFGRKHLFLGRIYTPSTGEVEAKEIYAYLPQSTIGDLLHYGAWEFYEKYGSRWNLYMELHDAVYIEFPKEDLHDWVLAMRECFIRSFKILEEEVLVDIDLTFGTSWGGQKPYVLPDGMVSTGITEAKVLGI